MLKHKGAAIIILLAAIINCSKFCEVDQIYQIGKQGDENIILAYQVRCQEKSNNWVGVTWKEKDKHFEPGIGKIFMARNSDYIWIERVSPDTVKVYTDTDTAKVKVEQARGITFVYERKDPEFFENDSLKVHKLEAIANLKDK